MQTIWTALELAQLTLAFFVLCATTVSPLAFFAVIVLEHRNG